jgi:hypothetical protein
MQNKPKPQQKPVKVPKKEAKVPSGKPDIRYVYRKDAFNKVKLA